VHDLYVPPHLVAISALALTSYRASTFRGTAELSTALATGIAGADPRSLYARHQQLCAVCGPHPAIDAEETRPGCCSLLEHVPGFARQRSRRLSAVGAALIAVVSDVFLTADRLRGVKNNRRGLRGKLEPTEVFRQVAVMRPVCSVVSTSLCRGCLCRIIEAVRLLYVEANCPRAPTRLSRPLSSFFPVFHADRNRR